jgi:hypothetical protein
LDADEVDRVAIRDASADPELGVVRAEALEFAALLLMERLSPAERAAYILRETFNCSYRAIARILQMKEPNARQLVTRARNRVSGARRVPAKLALQRRVVDALLAALRTGDLTTLERLLRRMSLRIPRTFRAAGQAEIRIAPDPRQNSTASRRRTAR